MEQKHRHDRKNKQGVDNKRGADNNGHDNPYNTYKVLFVQNSLWRKISRLSMSKQKPGNIFSFSYSQFRIVN